MKLLKACVLLNSQLLERGINDLLRKIHQDGPAYLIDMIAVDLEVIPPIESKDAQIIITDNNKKLPAKFKGITMMLGEDFTGDMGDRQFIQILDRKIRKASKSRGRA